MAGAGWRRLRPYGTLTVGAGRRGPDRDRETAVTESSDAPSTPTFEAEYALECQLRCPHCEGTIGSVQVVRLVRTRVNFVSLLPRRGYVIVCPLCHHILSAELGGSLTRAV